jgi:uncharacterized membrane protein
MMAFVGTESGVRWLEAAFERPVDILAFALWVLVFPVYHTLYPRLARKLPGRTTLEAVDTLRRSWIERVLATRDTVAAAQQTRNLNMVNTLLASSALILLGFAANLLLSREGAGGPPDVVTARVVFIVVVLAVAFAYFVNSLRHIGHFNLTIGADPALVDQLHGSAVEYFSGLIARSSRRYTQGIRTFYSAFPLFLWLFDGWLFLAVTGLWAAWFLAHDFSRLFRPGEGR